MEPPAQVETGGSSSSSVQAPAAGQPIGILSGFDGADRLVVYAEEEEPDEDTKVKAEEEDEEEEEEEHVQVKEEQDEGEPSSKRRRTDAK